MILGIGAHPDDLEYGVYGALAKHIREEGRKVHLLILTGGAQGNIDYAKRRCREAIASAKLLGATFEVGGFDSFDLDRVQPKIIDRISETLEATEYRRIYVVAEQDTNQQHWITTQCTRIAARFVPELVQYETASTRPEFTPNMFTDITDYMELKLECLRCHKSQSHRYYLQDHPIKCLNAYWYTKSRLGNVKGNHGYAEAFYIERMIE